MKTTKKGHRDRHAGRECFTRHFKRVRSQLGLAAFEQAITPENEAQQALAR